MRDVNRGWCEGIDIRVAVPKHGIGFISDSLIERRLRHHGVYYQAERIAKIHAGNQSRGKGKPQVGLRQELRVARVQAEVLVHQVPRAFSPLSRGMDLLDSFHQRIEGFRPAFHTRGVQREFGQNPGDMHAERPFLELHQIVHDVLGIDADKKWRELCVYHPPAHGRSGIGNSNIPARHVAPRMLIKLIYLLSQSAARIRWRQVLAQPEVIGAVQ